VRGIAFVEGGIFRHRAFEVGGWRPETRVPPGVPRLGDGQMVQIRAKCRGRSTPEELPKIRRTECRRPRAPASAFVSSHGAGENSGEEPRCSRPAARVALRVAAWCRVIARPMLARRLQGLRIGLCPADYNTRIRPPKRSTASPAPDRLHLVIAAVGLPGVATGPSVVAGEERKEKRSPGRGARDQAPVLIPEKDWALAKRAPPSVRELQGDLYLTRPGSRGEAIGKLTGRARNDRGGPNGVRQENWSWVLGRPLTLCPAPRARTRSLGGKDVQHADRCAWLARQPARQQLARPRPSEHPPAVVGADWQAAATARRSSNPDASGAVGPGRSWLREQTSITDDDDVISLCRADAGAPPLSTARPRSKKSGARLARSGSPWKGSVEVARPRRRSCSAP